MNRTNYQSADELLNQLAFIENPVVNTKITSFATIMPSVSEYRNCEETFKIVKQVKNINQINNL